MSAQSKKKRPKSPARILCVEDDPDVLEVLLLILARGGYSADSARNGMEAWAKIEKAMEAFDAVITDQHMPELDGVHLVSRLRTANYPGKIIVWAAATDPREQLMFTVLEVDGVVSKPEGADALLKILAKVVGKATAKRRGSPIAKPPQRKKKLRKKK